MTETPSDKVRDNILEAALMHAAFEGWNAKTLKLAVQDCNLPEGAEDLYFPGGAKELLSYWSERDDLKTEAYIQSKTGSNLRIRDKITEAVWFRLQLLEEHQEAARRAFSRLALPDTAGEGPKQIWATADTIWRALGDTSTDGNYYSKRTILSGVISTSLLTWLSDDSEDKSEARAFLERRIENVMQFEKTKSKIQKQAKALPDIPRILGRLRYGVGRRRRRY